MKQEIYRTMYFALKQEFTQILLTLSIYEHNAGIQLR